MHLIYLWANVSKSEFNWLSNKASNILEHDNRLRISSTKDLLATLNKQYSKVELKPIQKRTCPWLFFAVDCSVPGARLRVYVLVSSCVGPRRWKPQNSFVFIWRCLCRLWFNIDMLLSPGWQLEAEEEWRRRQPKRRWRSRKSPQVEGHLLYSSFQSREIAPGL